MGEAIKLTAIILTKNEEQNISRCLDSLTFCDEIVVIDDNSIDDTVKIAESKGAKIERRELNNDFTSQRNFGLEAAHGEWILFIDADEEVTPELRKEINKVVNSPIQKKAYYIPRRDFWWGRQLRFGEVLEARRLGFIRLVRKHSGKWIGKVHEKYLINSMVGKLNGYINHYPHPTVRDFISEVNMYSTIRAKELLSQGKKASIPEILTVPFAKFIYDYFFLLGFLDGSAGYAYSFFMSFHSFLVRAKLYQYNHFTSNAD